jgi:hypothetical protein
VSDVVAPPATAPAAAGSLTPTQLADLTELFRTFGPGNMRWLVERMLGAEGVQEVANQLTQPDAFARASLDLLDRRGVLSQAISAIRNDAPSSRTFIDKINRVLRGSRLAAPTGSQALLNDQEPFLHGPGFRQLLETAERTVCAIAIGPPNSLVGTGFLIGPDLVLTNYHVLRDCLMPPVPGGLRVTEAAPGSSIVCYFDYFVPPDPTTLQDKRKDVVEVAAKESSWLRAASLEMDNDGCPACDQRDLTKLDYALIQLARPVGLDFIRLGSTIRRGWLGITDPIDPTTTNQRLALLQHPGRSEQLFDLGKYVSIGRPENRLWYEVNTARGSSGGVALTKDGKVFALHNAAVEPTPPGYATKVNQGIRVDHIARELEQVIDPWPIPKLDRQISNWSLQDDLLNAVPLIGRQDFQASLQRMSDPESREQVLVVTGPPGSGRRFSKRIWERIVGRRSMAVAIGLDDLAIMSPEAFLQAVWAATGESDAHLPVRPPTESSSRWISHDAPRWLNDVLEANYRRQGERYPIWIIVDGVVEPGKKVDWAEGLRDLFAAIMKSASPALGEVKQTYLRWLFVGETADPWPTSGVICAPPDDLRDMADRANALQLERDVVQCLAAGLCAIDPKDDMSGTIIARLLFKDWLKNAPSGTPILGHLSDQIAGIIATGSKEREESGS